MPPPLGARGIMYSGCPSLHPSEAWITLFPPVHGSIGPSDQLWPFCGMSVYLSVHLERFLGIQPENAWREWPDILQADVSSPPPELVRLWSQSVDFPPFGATDLVKRVKFGVCGHFAENAWREWPEILHADVSWPPSELIVPADEVERGHRNGEHPSVHPSLRLSVRLGFPSIIWKSNHLINFKFSVCICWVSVQNWFSFGSHWPNFGPLVAKKLLEMGQNVGFRPLSQKVFTQSISNLWCTLVGWVVRIDSFWGHVGQILAL